MYLLGFWYGGVRIKYHGMNFEDMWTAVFCCIFAGMGAGQAFAFVPDAMKAVVAAHDIFRVMLGP